MSVTRAISTTSRRELSSDFFFLQGKAPKEIHAILTEILACFLPGRAKDLSALLLYYFQRNISCAFKYHEPTSRCIEKALFAFVRICICVLRCVKSNVSVTGPKIFMVVFLFALQFYLKTC